MAQVITSPSSVRRQVLQRIGWKLLIVSLAGVAFFALNSLHSLKSNYQKDRQAPLVIGEFAANTATSGHVVPLEYGALTREVASVLFPRRGGPEEAADLQTIRKDLADKKYAERLIPPLMASAQRIRDRVLWSVAKPASVRDESALIASLTESLDSANAAEQKSYADARERRLANYRTLAEKHANTPELSLKAKQERFLKEISSLSDKDKSPRLTDSLNHKVTTFPNVTLAELIEEAGIVEETDLSDINAALNGFAHTNYGRFYSAANRGLSDYVAKRRAAALSQSSLSPVLDENRGEYALYQAVFVTCVAILVFGLLYPIYLLLRLLPPFAASLDPLTDQAKQILSGRRDLRGAALATPAIAKTMALSVAAVGIGTAVAVANNGSSPRQRPAEDLSAIERELILNPKIRKLSDPPGPGPAGTPTPDVRLVALELRLDELALALGRVGNTPPDPRLALEVGRLRGQYDSMNGSLTELGRRTAPIEDIYTRTKDITPADVSLLRQIPVIQEDTGRLKIDVPKLNDNVKTLEQKANQVESTLFTKLDLAANRMDTANNQILGARFNDDGTSGQDLFSKARGLFRGSRYMISHQSYRIMENLICEQPVGFSGVLTDKTCSNEQSRLLLANMKKNIGQAPVSESKLLQTLGATSSAWKVQLLRYTRLPN